MLVQMQNEKDILYGISTRFALSSIDDYFHPELYVFVEDEEAETIINEILKMSDNTGRILNRISKFIHNVSSKIMLHFIIQSIIQCLYNSIINPVSFL